jgi:hypothetical protein
MPDHMCSTCDSETESIYSHAESAAEGMAHSDPDRSGHPISSFNVTGASNKDALFESDRYGTIEESENLKEYGTDPAQRTPGFAQKSTNSHSTDWDIVCETLLR